MRRSCLTISILVTTGLGAQDPLRGKALGLVRDQQGQPWAGAEVLLVSHPHPDCHEAARAEVLTTRTDQRGRFRIPIFYGRQYSVWARALEPDAQGRVRITDALETGRMGAPILLRERAEASHRPSIKIRGGAAWGALFVVARSRSVQELELPLRADEAGRYRFPALPGGGDLLVRNRAGLELVNVRVRAKQASELDVAVPAPQTLHLEIRDVADGKGIAAARVFVQEHAGVVELGRAAADGVATIRWPKGREVGWSRLFAQAAGHSAAAMQRGPSPRKHQSQKDWLPLRKGLKIARHVHLQKAPRFTGRILLGPEVPAQGVWLLLRGTGMHFSTSNSRSVQKYRELIPVDAEGRFAIPACLPEAYWRSQVDLVLSPQVRQKFPAGWPKDLPWVLRDVFEVSAGAVAKPNPLLDFSLSDLRPLRVQVRTAAGQEASEAELSCRPIWAGQSPNAYSHGQIWQPVGALGQATVLLRKGQSFALAARWQGGTCVVRLRPAAGNAEAGLPRLRMHLDKPVEVVGQLRDAQGKPVAGAQLNCRQGVRHARGPLIDSTQRISDVHGVSLDELSEQDIHGLAAKAVPRVVSTRTDAQGRFRFYLSRRVVAWTLQHTHESVTHKESIELEAGKDRIELQLEAR